jgi:hypothetical protein
MRAPILSARARSGDDRERAQRRRSGGEDACDTDHAPPQLPRPRLADQQLEVVLGWWREDVHVSRP